VLVDLDRSAELDAAILHQGALEEWILHWLLCDHTLALEVHESSPLAWVGFLPWWKAPTTPLPLADQGFRLRCPAFTRAEHEKGEKQKHEAQNDLLPRLPDPREISLRVRNEGRKHRRLHLSGCAQSLEDRVCACRVVHCLVPCLKGRDRRLPRGLACHPLRCSKCGDR